MIALLLIATAGAHARYDEAGAPRAAEMVAQAVRFATVAGNEAAHAAQKEWLLRTASALGLAARDAGTMTEIELPGPAGAPVLGLVVHGDVQPVDEKAWTIPPFAGVVRDGRVWGRGAADDKGPMVQALLAMAALKEAGPARTHTVRLLVGTDEESGSTDVKQYLAAHAPPDLSLVLDSEFPVVVGEKGWDGLTVSADPAERDARKPWTVASLDAGLAPSIVPDRARIVLRWRAGEADWKELIARLVAKTPPAGTRVEIAARGPELEVLAHGRAAHAGVNLQGGRNALVALARGVEGELPAGGADDLLAFARLAGQDLHGAALGLPQDRWGGYAVNVATLGAHASLAPAEDGKLTLVVNLRRPPPLTGPQARDRLFALVADFAARRGAALRPGGYFQDEPLAFDPQAKIVRRLMAAYLRATGEDVPPAISGGGTYAKRLPRSIAFGMWFPGKPYPGHDSDEQVPVADLHRGTHVLIEALLDLASTPPLHDPFAP
ncbi:MAG TPA: Sapep family Mn(2+)-dependent dipeptidase [Myxococcales bacterium]|nr:Sapep family Mn(2+)-dependent dipeptidase [Myxococcales bacterium]